MNIKQRITNKEIRNLWLFAAGKSVSIFGSSIYSFAIGLYVLKMTGSALNFATTLVLSYLPMIIISPVAGVIADRMSKKVLVVGTDFLNGLLFLSLFILAQGGHLNLPVIYTTTVLLNILTTFFGISIEAAKPNLVSPPQRLQMNAIDKLIDSSSAILGPMLGGLVYAILDIKAFILFNGLSFLISALSEWFIQYDLYAEVGHGEPHAAPVRSFKADLVEGLNYFKGSKRIMELFYLFVCLNFVLGFSVNVPGPYMINEVIGLPSKAYGLIYTMFPVGLIIGTLTVARILKRVPYRLLLIYMNGGIAVLSALVGVPALFPHDSPAMVYILFFCILHLLMGVAIAYVDIPITTLLQNEIPEALRGRVLSLVMSFVKIVLPVALLLSGKFIELLPIVIIPAIGGGIALSYSIFLLAFRREEKSLTAQSALWGASRGV